jgi:hypothetical protein
MNNIINSDPGPGSKGRFLHEVQRLIEASGRTTADLATAVELPAAVLNGANNGLVRIPGPKLKKLAAELGVSQDALLRGWLQEFQPWLVELLDDLMRDGAGAAPSEVGSGAEAL